MAKYNNNTSILDSIDEVLCFASSSILTPVDLHGDKKDILPMSKISALASVLAEREPRLSGLLANQMAKAKLVFEQTRHFPFIFIKLDNGHYISPFIVRRHHADSITVALVMQSIYALYRYILINVSAGVVPSVSIERPKDAGPAYDKLISFLPDNITIYKEENIGNHS